MKQVGQGHNLNKISNFPQHYEHIVHQRQLAKLPILGRSRDLVKAHFYVSGNRR